MADAATTETGIQLGVGALLAMGLIAVVLIVMIMWLTALIMRIEKLTLARCVVAAFALSMVTAGIGYALNGVQESGNGPILLVIAGGLALAVSALRMSLRTTVLKALGVLILHMMIGSIISSLYIRAQMAGGLTLDGS
jgi:hypothetical protein